VSEHLGTNPPERVKPPRILATFALAREFQRLLDTGAARNRSAVARRFGLTRTRVTQVMKLLTLAPEVIAHIEKGQAPVSERGLRAVLGTRPDQELRFVHARLKIASSAT
jgi:hypothetical protein